MKHVNTTHGFSKHPIFPRWKMMMERCYNPKNKKYPRYGGRGIAVCSRWKSVENFIADLGDPPFAGATLDRIDVNGNYEPANVRWATQKDQQNNRADSTRLTFRGKTKTVPEWAEELGIAPQIIHQRLRRDGRTVEEALSAPSSAKWAYRAKTRRTGAA